MTTQELTKRLSEIEPQVSRNDERIKKNDERLTKVEDEQKDQRKLLVVIERMASGLKSVEGKVDDICVRVHNIEEKPGKRWDALVGQVIAIIVGATLGFLITKVLG